MAGQMRRPATRTRSARGQVRIGGWLGVVLLVTAALAGCSEAGPREAPAASPALRTPAPPVTATPMTGTSTPAATAPPISGTQPNWTVIRLEHVQSPERYRFTVVVGGQERTFTGSRVCYEAAVPGQVLPERIETRVGYEVECRLDQ